MYIPKSGLKILLVITILFISSFTSAQDIAKEAMYLSFDNAFKDITGISSSLPIRLFKMKGVKRVILKGTEHVPDVRSVVIEFNDKGQWINMKTNTVDGSQVSITASYKDDKPFQIIISNRISADDFIYGFEYSGDLVKIKTLKGRWVRDLEYQLVGKQFLNTKLYSDTGKIDGSASPRKAALIMSYNVFREDKRAILKEININKEKYFSPNVITYSNTDWSLPFNIENKYVIVDDQIAGTDQYYYENPEKLVIEKTELDETTRFVYGIKDGLPVSLSLSKQPNEKWIKGAPESNVKVNNFSYEYFEQ
ncbi:hypothetical protein [Pedobacter cryoconitis]|uniref:Uncharacterized protein n=1 Tax=Pedobacter cryoconitis TaxID=188932 RepID=A0A327SXA0_9SPHI|nr:hypothetical protein [Pedobacter cryoconitis]RAJ30197.1 hypothetical protein LY11_02538 [Pedobacter cryoconitis]